jgi:hypothetical protein
MRLLKRVCVFCGSRPGTQPGFSDHARELGLRIAERGLELVYGGASVGLMGDLADAVLAAGGKVIGVIPRGLVEKELAHDGLDDLRVVESMHERKAMMADLSDAFIALPGGFGTLDELFEIITWAQIGLHKKPIGLLNTLGYFEHLERFVAHVVACGFVPREHTGLFLVRGQPAQLLDAMQAYSSPPPGDKWNDRR